MSLTQILPGFVSQFEKSFQEWKFFAELENSYDPVSGLVPVNRVRFVYEVGMSRLQHGLAMFWCRHFGHRWVDESYGGPESGVAGGYCERCGFSSHVVLY